jgi:hypothetical protein
MMDILMPILIWGMRNGKVDCCDALKQAESLLKNIPSQRDIDITWEDLPWDRTVCTADTRAEMSEASSCDKNLPWWRCQFRALVLNFKWATGLSVLSATKHSPRPARSLIKVLIVNVFSVPAEPCRKLNSSVSLITELMIFQCKSTLLVCYASERLISTGSYQCLRTLITFGT